MMEKNGRVEVGKTPSALSGKPSEMIKKGEAITKEEAPLLDDESEDSDEE